MQKTRLGNFFRHAAPIAFIVGLFSGLWLGSNAPGNAEIIFNLVLFIGLGVALMALLYVAGYLVDGVWFETRSDKAVAEEKAEFESGNRWLRALWVALPLGAVLVYNRDPEAFMSAWSAFIGLFGIG